MQCNTENFKYIHLSSIHKKKKIFNMFWPFFSIFFVEKKTEKYVPSEQLKADQTDVDAQVIAAIKAREDRKTLFGYLWTMFALRNRQYPHAMKFSVPVVYGILMSAGFR